jgi:hypothetical protein
VNVARGSSRVADAWASTTACPGWLTSISALAFAPLSGIAHAEGAVRIIDCAIARVCDAAGACEPGSRHVAFRVAPIDVDAAGAGRYGLSYAEIDVEGDAFSAAGPFFWTVGNERDTLVASSETQFLWHRLIVDSTQQVTISFLTCALSQ